MDLSIAPGTYVVAVSGGVDSMVLLDLMVKQPGLKLVVAHYDHGIRVDSAVDRQFVQRAAKRYGFPFVFDEAQLGPGASEAVARDARYEFLESVRQAARADAIVTAHHRDDLLETALMNVLRGTSRRGLTSLSSRSTLVRPLLHLPKQQLIDYARSNGLQWREDSTNQNLRYKRNQVRHQLLPVLSLAAKDEMVRDLAELASINKRIDQLLSNHLHTQPGATMLDRHWFIMLPHAVATDIMALWLREHGVHNLDATRLELITSRAKTLRPGNHWSVDGHRQLWVGDDVLALELDER